MRTSVLLFIFVVAIYSRADAQWKEAAQFATLSPVILVVYSDIEHYQKSHYMVSAIGYLGSYMILESEWKAALLTLFLGAAKEIVYDGLLGKGEPLWDDMKWNSLGIAQGAVFTISLKF